MGSDGSTFYINDSTELKTCASSGQLQKRYRGAGAAPPPPKADPTDGRHSPKPMAVLAVYFSNSTTKLCA